ncbi:carbohydrate ABC transporter permease [Gemmiger formicilis]|uniref:carbohydrate ABC transporter permease n=1 Tax=Gemmiger formicilis TaxID=745368 RepID=UPI001955F9D0|nr:carbohydrate ABC transporter permease [Gemmiger formicilis]MBM6914382.1 carbohydrate ABC transporter permease [Gemmiger formicilis]
MEKIKKRMTGLGLNLLMSFFSLVALFPLLWVVLIAFQPTDQGVSFVLSDILTKRPTLDNFIRVSELIPMWQNFCNSVVVSVVGTLLTLFFCSLAGYAFAKFRFPGRDGLFFLLLFTMIIPPEVCIVPLYVVMQKLHWINSMLSLIIPRAATAVGIFYMRQYIGQYPTEILEQARIDGCREFGIFCRVVVPGITPALASWGAISLIARWNDFLLPMVFLRNPQKQTLMVAISQLPVSDGLSTPWPVVMAGIAVATVPLLLAFLFLQKYDIADLMAGSTKG